MEGSFQVNITKLWCTCKSTTVSPLNGLADCPVDKPPAFECVLGILHYSCSKHTLSGNTTADNRMAIQYLHTIHNVFSLVLMINKVCEVVFIHWEPTSNIYTQTCALSVSTCVCVCTQVHVHILHASSQGSCISQLKAPWEIVRVFCSYMYMYICIYIYK